MAECSVSSYSYRVGSWNSGEPFDYRNVLLRTGGSSSELNIQKQYLGIKPLYDAAMAKFEEKARLNPSAQVNHREHPRCQVSAVEAAFIGENRIEKIKSIWNVLFEVCDFVLLQEVMPEETPILQSIMPKKFDLCIGKDFEREKYCFDTMIAWNAERFTKIAPEGNETTQRKSTIVLLRDNLTQKIVQLTSLHARGFNIADPSQGLKENEVLFSDQDIVDMLKKGESFEIKPDIRIFGGDFNSEYLNPVATRNHELAQNRFNLMEKQGFIHIENNIPTSFNKAITEIPGRENGLCTLDHLFVQCTSDLKISGKHHDDFSFPLERLDVNPSDHRPLLFTVSGQ